MGRQVCNVNLIGGVCQVLFTSMLRTESKTEARVSPSHGNQIIFSDDSAKIYTIIVVGEHTDGNGILEVIFEPEISNYTSLINQYVLRNRTVFD
jgi:hypothetical protein